jgi:hypothetical protein
LNASLTEVFSVIKGDPAFRWPQKMKTAPFKRDRSKFCEYHADHGHLTEDCISLRREIEVFIQNGRLVRFLVEERNREANRRGAPEGVREGLERAESRRRTKLRERFDVTKNEGIFEKNPSRTRTSFERSTPSPEELLAEET